MQRTVEIELKYRINDLTAVQQLLAAERIGPYAIDGFECRQIEDTYYDTADHAFAAANYAFRFRQKPGKNAVQLKTLDKAEGSYHRRTELQIVTDRPATPESWEPDPGRELVLEILAGRQLAPLFTVSQTRYIAHLLRDGVPIAELSVDGVVWQVGERCARSWELEIEFFEDADESDIEVVDAAIKQAGQVTPQASSKYERGLALLSADSAAGDEVGPGQRVEPAGNEDVATGVGIAAPGASAQIDENAPPASAPPDPAQVPTPPATTFYLQADEAVPAGIKRILLEQIDRAYWQLTEAEDKDDAVHDARKCFKKTRAILRLVRDEIGEDIYRRENVLYRDAARRLSALRSSAVIAETLDTLVDHFSDQLSPNAFDDVRASLLAMHRQAYEELVEEGDLLGEVAAIIQIDRDHILHLPLEREGFSTLSRGIRRVYGRGRKEMLAARADPTTPHLHVWRKRVKYLRYQTRILKELWPNLMLALVMELVDLSDDLGLDHDLAEFGDIALAHPQLFEDAGERQALLDLIERYRLELQTHAFALGARVYTESPRAFVKRLEGYWDAWREF